MKYSIFLFYRNFNSFSKVLLKVKLYYEQIHSYNYQHLYMTDIDHRESTAETSSSKVGTFPPFPRLLSNATIIDATTSA